MRQPDDPGVGGLEDPSDWPSATIKPHSPYNLSHMVRDLFWGAFVLLITTLVMIGFANRNVVTVTTDHPNIYVNR